MLLELLFTLIQVRL